MATFDEDSAKPDKENDPENGKVAVVSEKTGCGGFWRNYVDEAGWKGDFTHFNRADPFHMKANGVTLRTELRAGVVTFLTMVYILPVNSGILANAIRPDNEQGFGAWLPDLVVATAASSGIACILMGLMSNFPFALAPGMGTNAFFAFTIVGKFGVPWQTALAAIWIAGFVFAGLSFIGVRTLMVKSCPPCIRLAMACGIGLFLAIIGLKDMGLITNDGATFVTLNLPLTSNNPDYQKLWLGIIVLIVMGVALARKIPGAILIGILFGTFVCWIDAKVVDFDKTDPMRHPSHFCYPVGVLDDTGSRRWVFGQFVGGQNPPQVTTGGCTPGSYIYFPTKFAQTASARNVAGKLQFKNMNSGGFLLAFLTFVYCDILDNTGTFFAVCKLAGMLDPVTMNLPTRRANMAYLSDAISTIIGASLGTSTIVTYIESGTGVRDGGRTGVVAITTGVLFLLTLPFAPWMAEVPGLASGPALVIVGVLMMEGVRGIDWELMEDAIPAFLCIVCIPYFFNIAYGIVIGCASWLIGQLCLAPIRLLAKEDPLVRFKDMFAGNLASAMAKEDVEEARARHELETARIAAFRANEAAATMPK